MMRLGSTIAVGLTAAAAARWLVPPDVRLAARLRPYLIGTVPGVAAIAPWRSAAEGPDLALRLRQAGFLPVANDDVRVAAFRRGLVGAGVRGAGIGAGVGLLAGLSVVACLVLAGVSAAAGAIRFSARIDRAITDRRELMRIELVTINQLLALHVRVGGGVTQALQRITARGDGAVVEELQAILRAHRGGHPISEALDDSARTTPEPHAARTYRLLARGADFGADLALGLRALSDDLRQERREALVRTATRRRAAMLLPIIGLLAPVMLIFVAAPLPSIVFGS